VSHKVSSDLSWTVLPSLPSVSSVSTLATLILPLPMLGYEASRQCPCLC
jgi:hypothetical protein